MKNLKFTLILITGLLVANFSRAQTIEDGKKFLYYEKFISAKNVFQQLLTANAKIRDRGYRRALTPPPPRGRRAPGSSPCRAGRSCPST